MAAQIIRTYTRLERTSATRHDLALRSPAWQAIFNSLGVHAADSVKVATPNISLVHQHAFRTSVRLLLSGPCAGSVGQHWFPVTAWLLDDLGSVLDPENNAMLDHILDGRARLPDLGGYAVMSTLNAGLVAFQARCQPQGGLLQTTD